MPTTYLHHLLLDVQEVIAPRVFSAPQEALSAKNSAGCGW